MQNGMKYFDVKQNDSDDGTSIIQRIINEDKLQTMDKTELLQKNQELEEYK